MNPFMQRVGQEIRVDPKLQNCVRHTPSNTEVEFVAAARRAANQVFGDVTDIWKRISEADPVTLQQLREFIPDAASLTVPHNAPTGKHEGVSPRPQVEAGETNPQQ